MTLASAHAAERRRFALSTLGGTLRLAAKAVFVAGFAVGGFHVQREVVRDQFGFDIAVHRDWRKLELLWRNGLFALDTPRRWQFAGALVGGAAVVVFGSFYLGTRGPAAISAVSGGVASAAGGSMRLISRLCARPSADSQPGCQGEPSESASGAAKAGRDRAAGSANDDSIVGTVRRLRDVTEEDLTLLANQQDAISAAVDREIAGAAEKVRSKTVEEYYALAEQTARGGFEETDRGDPDRNDADRSAPDRSAPDQSALDQIALDQIRDAATRAPTDAGASAAEEGSLEARRIVANHDAQPRAQSEQAGPTLVEPDSFVDDEKLRSIESVRLLLGQHGAVFFQQDAFGCDIVCLLGGDLVLVRMFTRPGDYSADDSANVATWADINTQVIVRSPAEALLALQSSLVGALGARLAENEFGVRSLLCLAGRARLVDGLADFWQANGLEIVDASASGVCGDDLPAIESALAGILRSGRNFGAGAPDAIETFVVAGGFKPARDA